MSNSFNRFAGQVSAGLATIVFAACGGTQSTSPTLSDGAGLSAVQLGHLTLCKVGTDASFNLTRDGVTHTLSLAAGECQDIAQAHAGDPTVTIEEVAAANTVLDSIVDVRSSNAGTSRQKVTNTRTVTVNIGGDFERKVTFFNRPTTPPGEGVLTLCKVGTDASFNITIDNHTRTVSLTAGQCQDIAQAHAGDPVVTIEEVVPLNTVLDSIVDQKTAASGNTRQKITGTNQITTNIGVDFNRTVTFYNRPVSGSGQGEGTLTLCKVGTDASFQITIDNVTRTISLAAGGCNDIAKAHAGDPVVTIKELVPANTVLDSIVDVKTSSSGTTRQKFTGTNPITTNIGVDFNRTVTFYNRPVQRSADQGCSPGYWKQDQHWDSWPAPYTATTLFSKVFEDAFPSLSLVQVLKLKGGGLNALGRQTVAALLNSASTGVSYGSTPQQVIAAFNAVFPGGDYEGLKDRLEANNQRGCPLN